GGLGGGQLLAAAAFGHAAGEGTGDRVGIDQVAAVVHPEPVAPGAAFRFAHERDAAAAVARRHRGEDLVAPAAQPAEGVEPAEHGAAIGIGTAHLGADLQAVAGAFDFLGVG